MALAFVAIWEDFKYSNSMFIRLINAEFSRNILKIKKVSFWYLSGINILNCFGAAFFHSISVLSPKNKLHLNVFNFFNSFKLCLKH